MIVLTLKSRNEEKNIRNAIESYYDVVDRILLADGESTDDTVKIASEYPKVSIREFHEFYERPDKSRRNHEGRHLNFLFGWAEDVGADWIIHDDCDCVLNRALREDGRAIISGCQSQTVHACRLYVYGTDTYFRRMTYFNDEWQPGLWAWRADTHLRSADVLRHFTVPEIESYSKCVVLPPYCILHKFAPTEDVVQRKLNDYLVEEPNAVHPKVTYGEPELLPEWARE